MEPDPAEPQRRYSSYFCSFSPAIFLIAFNTPIILGVLLLALLLYASALISSSEVAFFSLTHNDFAKLEEENSKSGNRILQLKEKPRTLLATILVSNNFINVAIILLSDILQRRILEGSSFFSNASNWLIEAIPFLASFSESAISRGLNNLITVVGVTFLLVLFGEVAPKIYAQINSIRLARFMSGPLKVLVRVLAPMSALLVRGTNIIEKRLDRFANARNASIKENLDEVIDLTVSEDDNLEEIDILKSIVKFGDVSAKQIMRSRVDVIGIDYRENYKELLRIIQENNYSRLPIYEDDFDHVKGILYVKDLLGHLDEKATYKWQKHIKTDVLYIPESKKIDELLKEFQAKKLHLGVVVDEYGGSSGIVTLEDILEEVIGEIKDEFDSEKEVEFTKIDEFTYDFEGKSSLKDVCRIINIDTETFDEIKGEADTIAGLILEVSGFIPKEHEEFEFGDYQFRIEAVTIRRIETVRIKLPH